MKLIIIFTNIIAILLFVGLIISMGNFDALTGILGFLILVVPFLFILTMVNVILYVVFRVTRRKTK